MFVSPLRLGALFHKMHGGPSNTANDSPRATQERPKIAPRAAQDPKIHQEAPRPPKSDPRDPGGGAPDRLECPPWDNDKRPGYMDPSCNKKSESKSLLAPTQGQRPP